MLHNDVVDPSQNEIHRIVAITIGGPRVGDARSFVGCRHFGSSDSITALVRNCSHERRIVCDLRVGRSTRHKSINGIHNETNSRWTTLTSAPKSEMQFEWVPWAATRKRPTSWLRVNHATRLLSSAS